jgi:anti-anti-sigma regulatory factor
MKLIIENISGVLRLAGALEIGAAEELHRGMTEYFRGGPKFALDLSDVEECDTAALQLICSLRNSAGQAREPFQVIAASPAVLETCAALGLPPGQLSWPAVAAPVAGCGGTADAV